MFSTTAPKAVQLLLRLLSRRKLPVHRRKRERPSKFRSGYQVGFNQWPKRNISRISPTCSITSSRSRNRR
ncbi:hypothetical protein H9L39_14458 [Fusarium oxysporum f. sp. albedinis]|nr:hypothetical protein H9L39_14458 [Fusarium oxysporum f. sp. albedinis]